MNTPKSGKHTGEKPLPHERKRANIETPIDGEPPPRAVETPEEEKYRPAEERYTRGETRRMKGTWA